MRPIIDPTLSVELNTGERAVLVENPHSTPGLVTVAMTPDSLDDPRLLNVPVRDIARASECAIAWIDGFLHGSEPEPEGMFGEGWEERRNAEELWERWVTALRVFHATGLWFYDRRMCSLCRKMLLPSEPSDGRGSLACGRLYEPLVVRLRARRLVPED